MDNILQADNWDYIISGKQNGIARIIIMSIISAFFTLLTVDQLRANPNFSIVATLFGSITIISTVILTILIIKYFCFKICIGKNGFLFRTNPFDSRYYKYTDIIKCDEILITSQHRTASGARETAYNYYFTFTANNDEVKKIKFEKSIHEREFNILKERINNCK